MSAWRIGLGGALLAAVVALAAVGFAHRSRGDSLVRVGGHTNACACTHRIEP